MLDAMVGEHLGIEREIGSLTARMNNVEGVVHDIQVDVKTLVHLAEQMKGSKKTLLTVAGVSGVVGGIATKLGMFVGIMPR